MRYNTGMISGIAAWLVAQPHRSLSLCNKLLLARSPRGSSSNHYDVESSLNTFRIWRQLGGAPPQTKKKQIHSQYD